MRIEKRYIPKLDTELSPLGFGVMRLPMDGDSFTREAYTLIDSAMDAGVNYYDTGYRYQKSRSEEFIKETIVSRYPRDTFNIADKLPSLELLNNNADIQTMERIFQLQLERLGVEYIDFYLLHQMSKAVWNSLYEKNVIKFLDRKIKEGRIRKVGFSLHDNLDALKTIESAYDWDFIMLQINYYDWETLCVDKCYKYLEERDIPCMVMEPVGGGRLSKLPKKAESVLTDIRPDASSSSWAIRFAASLPNVAVTLSGMSNTEQLRDNLSCFLPFTPINNTEYEALDKVVGIIRSFNAIPCTYCGYCIEKCPKKINIPLVFQLFNDCGMFDSRSSFKANYRANQPLSCTKCNKCVKACPQKLNIPLEFEKVENFENELMHGFSIDKLKRYIEKCKQSKARVVLFGAGRAGKKAHKSIERLGCNIDCFCDNMKSLWGTHVNDIPVISLDELKNKANEMNVLVLITSGNYADVIKKQLDELGIPVFYDK